MTGRAAGYCAGYPVPGYMNPVGGRMGWGRGGGWGRRNWFHATGQPGWQRAAYGAPAFGAPGYAAAYGAPYAAPTKDQQLEAMKDEAGYLQQALEDIQKRIAELESEE